MALRLISSKKKQDSINRRRVSKPTQAATAAKVTLDEAEAGWSGFVNSWAGLADMYETQHDILRYTQHKPIQVHTALAGHGIGHNDNRPTINTINEWNTNAQNITGVRKTYAGIVSSDKKNRNIFNRNLSIDAAKLNASRADAQKKRTGIGRFTVSLNIDKQRSGGLGF